MFFPALQGRFGCRFPQLHHVNVALLFLNVGQSTNTNKSCNVYMTQHMVSAGG